MQSRNHTVLAVEEVGHLAFACTAGLIEHAVTEPSAVAAVTVAVY